MLPRIKTFADLLKTLAGLFITFLAVHGFIAVPGRTGVVAMLAPTLADRFYNIFGDVLAVISYLILLALLLLIPLAIWSYFRNRHKSDEASITVSESGINGLVKQVNDLRKAKTILDKGLSSLEGSGQGEDKSSKL